MNLALRATDSQLLRSWQTAALQQASSMPLILICTYLHVFARVCNMQHDS